MLPMDKDFQQESNDLNAQIVAALHNSHTPEIFQAHPEFFHRHYSLRSASAETTLHMTLEQRVEALRQLLTEVETYVLETYGPPQERYIGPDENWAN